MWRWPKQSMDLGSPAMRVPSGGSNGSIAEGADQTRKRNRKAVRDDRWNAVPISNYRRLDE
jgi:hypothetical protein